jgi:hypothetical protein
VFAREVANLARGWVRWVAGSGFATLVRIEMGKGAAAITRAGDGLVVNMVAQEAGVSLRALEVDGTYDPGAVSGGEFEGTKIEGKSGNIASLIEGVSGLFLMGMIGEGELPCAFWVVVNDGRVTKLACVSSDGDSEKRTTRKKSEY